MKNIDFFIIAKIRLFTKEEGGRGCALPAIMFPCPFVYKGNKFDCGLFLNIIGEPIEEGQSKDVPIKFLYPELIMPLLKRGDHFYIWELKNIGEGEIIGIHNIDEALA